MGRPKYHDFIAVLCFANLLLKLAANNETLTPNFVNTIIIVAATIAAMMSTSDVFILIAGGIGIINALIVLSRHYLILNSSCKYCTYTICYSNYVDITITSCLLNFFQPCERERIFFSNKQTVSLKQLSLPKSQFKYFTRQRTNGVIQNVDYALSLDDNQRLLMRLSN